MEPNSVFVPSSVSLTPGIFITPKKSITVALELINPPKQKNKKTK
jgi:hypothetical protein